MQRKYYIPLPHSQTDGHLPLPSVTAVDKKLSYCRETARQLYACISIIFYTQAITDRAIHWTPRVQMLHNYS